MGEIGCFSFFPSKNLGGYGDGGMCTTNDAALAHRIRVLRVHGSEPKYHHALIGGNFRLDELQAAVLLVKLKYLDGWTERRQRNAAFYSQTLQDARLADNIQTPTTRPGYRHIYNQYVLRVRQRDALRTFLAESGVGTEIYYPIPLHMQKCFAYLDCSTSDCPNAVRAAEETIALPIYPELTDVQLRYVVDRMIEFYS